jgi:hypothetical protein
MQVNLCVALKEVFDRLTLVRRKVVSDHMDLFAVRLIGDDIGEEGDELGRCVPGGQFYPVPGPGTDAFRFLLRTGTSLERFVHDSRSRLIEHNRDDESNHGHSGCVNHESIAVGECRPFRCAEI